MSRLLAVAVATLMAALPCSGSTLTGGVEKHHGKFHKSRITYKMGVPGGIFIEDFGFVILEIFPGSSLADYPFIKVGDRITSESLQVPLIRPLSTECDIVVRSHIDGKLRHAVLEFKDPAIFIDALERSPYYKQCPDARAYRRLIRKNAHAI